LRRDRRGGVVAKCGDERHAHLVVHKAVAIEVDGSLRFNETAHPLTLGVVDDHVIALKQRMGDRDSVLRSIGHDNGGLGRKSRKRVVREATTTKTHVERFINIVGVVVVQLDGDQGSCFLEYVALSFSF
jgi:hypothetical protein